MASRALTHRLARIWSIWEGSTLDRPQILPRLPGKIDVLADEPPQHLEHARHGLVQVQHLGRDGLLAGKGQQLPGEVGGALGGLLDLLKVGMERLRRVHLLEGHLRMPEDHPQHVVEIVGHAARQPAHRFHLLGLQQLRLERILFFLRPLAPLALGDVLKGHHRAHDLAVPGDRHAGILHGETAAVLAPEHLVRDMAFGGLGVGSIHGAVFHRVVGAVLVGMVDESVHALA